MLKKTRFTYFIMIVSVIILGILSRKIEGIPPFFGDTIYAVMIYFGLRFLFIKTNSKITIVLAIVICFCIEFLQLYRAEWILAIRRTKLGHYALGQGFLWSDLAYYTLGILIAFWIDFILAKKDNVTNLH
jgi:hypothetical protein